MYTVYNIPCLNTEKKRIVSSISADLKMFTQYGINKIPVLRIRKYFFWIRIRNSDVRILIYPDPDRNDFLPRLLLLFDVTHATGVSNVSGIPAVAGIPAVVYISAVAWRTCCYWLPFCC